jgi:exopolyphosphatase/guanosine-5'-triphosphate,3'-diphosphate pyrophosphatase
LKLYVVRHARAVARDEWAGEDLLRPVSDRGAVESEALAEHLSDDPPGRVICAPSVRCQQTAEPTAVAAGVPVEVDERLAEAEDVAHLLQLLPSRDPRPTLLCTHGPVIESLLRVLELSEPGRESPVPCRKGSVWVLEGPGLTPTRARYFEPVKRPNRKGRVRYSAGEEMERPHTVRAAVLDMGSTSFTLLIADVTREGEILPVLGEKVMLRLGAVIASRSRIPKEVRRRAVDVARQLHTLAVREKAQIFLPVATAAVREAENGDAIAAAIGEAVNEPVRILSGEEEARTMFRAFRRRLDLGGTPVLGLDLGGGSLELALGSARELALETTLPLGAVRLHGEIVAHDPMKGYEVEAIRSRVLEQLVPHQAGLARSSHAVATGGTVRALGRLITQVRGDAVAEGESARLTRDELHELTERLVASRHDERLDMRGVRRRRADLLPTGAVILSTLCDALGVETLTICDWGLRHGVLLDALDHNGFIGS